LAGFRPRLPGFFTFPPTTWQERHKMFPLSSLYSKATVAIYEQENINT
jgi:hypothetical protein